MLAEVRRRADQFDVIHFHTDMIHFPFFEDMARERTVTTLHGRLDLKDLAGVYRRWPQFPLVSISDDQRRPLPFANWAATVHHGMAAELYRFSPRPRAIWPSSAASRRRSGPTGPSPSPRRLGGALKIAAKVDAADRDLFRGADRAAAATTR